MKSDLLSLDYFHKLYEKNSPLVAYNVILGILLYAMYENDIGIEEYFYLYNVNKELKGKE